MSNEFWMSLTEYSAKHGVSVSTLRRRIKKDEIPYVLDNGKYILPDKPFGELESSYQSTMVAPPQSVAQNSNKKASQPRQQEESFLEPLGLSLSIEEDEDLEEEGVVDKTPETTKKAKQSSSLSISSGPKSNGPMDELKKAYALILQEKEEQITYLKQHIVDLQTLNKAFENEIDRLNDEKIFDEPSFMKHTF